MRRITPRTAVVAALLTGTALIGGTAVANAASAPTPPSSSTAAAPIPSQDSLTPGDTVDNPADPQGGQHEATNEADDATEAPSAPEQPEVAGSATTP